MHIGSCSKLGQKQKGVAAFKVQVIQGLYIYSRQVAHQMQYLKALLPFRFLLTATEHRITSDRFHLNSPYLGSS